LLLAAVLAALALAACGVKVDLEPPAGMKDTGPRDRIGMSEARRIEAEAEGFGLDRFGVFACVAQKSGLS